jgi:dolichol-phosphate mannosyltransferase
VAWTGFDQSRVLYDRRQRQAGRSGWTFGRMIKTMWDAFVGFSALPIRVMTFSALGAAVLAVGLAIDAVIRSARGTRVPGWASQMLVLAGFFAIMFAFMAIIGEYLYRIYAESVNRPPFFVSDDTAERR